MDNKYNSDSELKEKNSSRLLNEDNFAVNMNLNIKDFMQNIQLSTKSLLDDIKVIYLIYGI